MVTPHVGSSTAGKVGAGMGCGDGPVQAVSVACADPKEGGLGRVIEDDVLCVINVTEEGHPVGIGGAAP